MFNNKAMIADLTVSLWNAKKFDEAVTTATTTQHKANSRSGRFNKSLINPDSLKPIQRARTALEEYHKFNTQPWHQGGGRLLPSVTFMKYTTAMRQLTQPFDAEVHTFLANYPSEITKAKVDLGDMFDANDYPSVADLKAKFAVTIDLTPFPIECDDWRVTMAKEDADEAAEQMRQTYEKKEQAVVRESYVRAQRVVQKMYDSLSDPTKIFRDSLVENVTTVADLLPALNLTNDPTLAEITAHMQTELNATPQELRDNPVARARTAAAAAAILTKLASGLT